MEEREETAEWGREMWVIDFTGFCIAIFSLQFFFFSFFFPVKLFKEQWKKSIYNEATVGRLGKGSFQGLAVPSGSGFVLCFIEHIVLFSVSTTRLAQYRQHVPYLQDETRLF